MSQTLVFVETSDIGTRYLREASKKLGLTPLFVFRHANYQADTLKQLTGSEHLLADTSSYEELLRCVSLLPEKPAAIMSVLDAYMPTASRLGTELGCLIPDEGIARAKDKYLASEILGNLGPNTLALSLAQPEEEWTRSLEGLFDCSPHGILLKPRFGSGALGLHFVSKKEDLRYVHAKLTDRKVTGCPETTLWIAQSRIDGGLVSCEGYCKDGEVTVLGFTGRSKVDKTESRAYFPFDQRLSSSARDVATIALQVLLAGLGIRSTYFHSEFIVSGESAQMIDANIGRIGGGPIGEMVALSYGLDPTILYAHYILTSLPALAKIDPREADEIQLEMSAALNRARQETLSLLYGAPFDCSLIGVHIPEKLMSRHTQLLSAGHRISKMGENNWDWIGILTGFPDAVWTDFNQIYLETEAGLATPLC